MKRLVLSAVILAGSASLAAAPQKLKPEEVQRHARLDVIVPDFPVDGLILDIGGGGEGVIAQLKGKQVVAIDLSKRELDEVPAASDPLLKIVMDARDLKFVDRSFATATVFFTFMYIDPADHAKVFREIHRVLKPGGRLLVWDPVFPAKDDPGRVAILFPVRATLPRTVVTTGYGVPFREGQNADHFVGLAKDSGFQIVSRKDEQGWFMLEMKKGD
jgi:SAM-dependent methyltransferase